MEEYDSRLGGRGLGDGLLMLCSPHVLRQDSKFSEGQRSRKRVINSMFVRFKRACAHVPIMTVSVS
jgi:hypothetical protein